MALLSWEEADPHLWSLPDVTSRDNDEDDLDTIVHEWALHGLRCAPEHMRDAMLHSYRAHPVWSLSFVNVLKDLGCDWDRDRLVNLLRNVVIQETLQQNQDRTLSLLTNDENTQTSSPMTCTIQEAWGTTIVTDVGRFFYQPCYYSDDRGTLCHQGFYYRPCYYPNCSSKELHWDEEIFGPLVLERWRHANAHAAHEALPPFLAHELVAQVVAGLTTERIAPWP